MPPTALELYRAEVRQIAWSGLAAVWVFKQDSSDGLPTFTIQLALAGFFVICALAADFLEATLIAFDASPDRSHAARRVLFLLKVGLLGFGYLWLLAHVVRVLRVV